MQTLNWKVNTLGNSQKIIHPEGVEGGFKIISPFGQH
jgi:hypothetical protein